MSLQNAVRYSYYDVTFKYNIDLHGINNPQYLPARGAQVTYQIMATMGASNNTNRICVVMMFNPSNPAQQNTIDFWVNQVNTAYEVANSQTLISSVVQRAVGGGSVGQIYNFGSPSKMGEWFEGLFPLKSGWQPANFQ